MTPPLPRVPGTAVFLNRGKATAPLALRANVEHNHVLHKHVLILTIETMPAPHVPAAERITVDDLGYKDDRITHVTARFGYMDQQNVPALLPLIREAEIEGPLDSDELSYFLSRIEIVLGNTPGMSRWRKRLFIATSQITADAAEVFPAPPRTHPHRGLAHRALAPAARAGPGTEHAAGGSRRPDVIVWCSRHPFLAPSGTAAHAIMAEPSAGTVRAGAGRRAWATLRRRWTRRSGAGAARGPRTP